MLSKSTWVRAAAGQVSVLPPDLHFSIPAARGDERLGYARHRRGDECHASHHLSVNQSITHSLEMSVADLVSY